MEPTPGAAMRRLTQQDLKHLVCPVCFGPLQLESDAIACNDCGHRFPVVDGLAVLMPDRAL